MKATKPKPLLCSNLRLVLFSYLPGTTLFHKISLINKATRKALPDSALLDQIIVIPIKIKEILDQKTSGYLRISFLLYAARLADIFQV